MWASRLFKTNIRIDIFIFFHMFCLSNIHTHLLTRAEERRQASPLLGRSVYESHKWLFNIVVIRVVIWVELSLIVARHACSTPANIHSCSHTHTDAHTHARMLGFGQTGCSRSNSHHMPTNWAVVFVCVYVCAWFNGEVKLVKREREEGGRGVPKIFVLKFVCVCKHTLLCILIKLWAKVASVLHAAVFHHSDCTHNFSLSLRRSLICPLCPFFIVYL